MDKDRIEKLLSQAKEILEGDADNYDGADAARIIKELCNELLNR